MTEDKVTENVLKVKKFVYDLRHPKELQRIEITGKNWNDIIKLPCFRELKHNCKGWNLLLYVNFENGHIIADDFKFYLRKARIGDAIVEYEYKQWGIIRKS